MRALSLGAAILAAACFICAGAWSDTGQLYSAEVTAAPVGAPGSNTWAYTAYNTSASSDYALWLLAIEVDELCDVLSVVSPPGWGADYSSQPHFITWIYFAGEVPAGASASGFEATFSCQPLLQTYSVMFDNINNPGETPVDYGEVSIPEPAGAAVLLAGFLSGGALILRRRR